MCAAIAGDCACREWATMRTCESAARGGGAGRMVEVEGERPGAPREEAQGRGGAFARPQGGERGLHRPGEDRHVAPVERGVAHRKVRGRDLEHRGLDVGRAEQRPRVRASRAVPAVQVVVADADAPARRHAGAHPRSFEGVRDEERRRRARAPGHRDERDAPVAPVGKERLHHRLGDAAPVPARRELARPDLGRRVHVDDAPVLRGERKGDVAAHQVDRREVEPDRARRPLARGADFAVRERGHILDHRARGKLGAQPQPHRHSRGSHRIQREALARDRLLRHLVDGNAREMHAAEGAVGAPAVLRVHELADAPQPVGAHFRGRAPRGRDATPVHDEHAIGAAGDLALDHRPLAVPARALECRAHFVGAAQCRGCIARRARVERPHDDRRPEPPRRVHGFLRRGGDDAFRDGHARLAQERACERLVARDAHGDMARLGREGRVHPARCAAPAELHEARALGVAQARDAAPARRGDDRGGARIHLGVVGSHRRAKARAAGDRARRFPRASAVPGPRGPCSVGIGRGAGNSAPGRGIAYR